jgi:hypothetical protein
MVKKGDGRDAKPDDSDGYAYSKGHFYQVIFRATGKAPIAAVLFGLCAAIAARLKDAGRQLTERNRWAKRRVANAYAWLDRNESQIRDCECLECLAQVQRCPASAF